MEKKKSQSAHQQNDYNSSFLDQQLIIFHAECNTVAVRVNIWIYQEPFGVIYMVCAIFRHLQKCKLHRRENTVV